MRCPTAVVAGDVTSRIRANVSMVNRKARRQVQVHDRSRDVPSTLHHTQPAPAATQFSTPRWEEELCAPHAEITVELPQAADVSDERAAEIVETMLHIRRK